MWQQEVALSTPTWYQGVCWSTHQIPRVGLSGPSWYQGVFVGTVPLVVRKPAIWYQGYARPPLHPIAICVIWYSLLDPRTA